MLESRESHDWTHKYKGTTRYASYGTFYLVPSTELSSIKSATH
jgi:hypothetical protein